jgi:putative ABC transport system substrate-binding protein
MMRDVQEAARAKGLQLPILKAGTESEIDAAFAALVQQQAGALVVGADPFFRERSEQVAALASRHAVPAIYSIREFAASGGLISYGASITSAYHRAANAARPRRRGHRMSLRREFLVGLCTALGWPFAARAQQKAMPVIGFLSARSAGASVLLVAAFHRGLSEAGYVEGQNVKIEYRWAEGQYDRLPALAADLVDRKVDLIATSGGPSPAQAAKSATATIPITFVLGTDPVELGLVTSLARPGGNLTGVSMMMTELNAKRLELLSELVPQARVIALLVNPNYPGAERIMREVQDAARATGVQVLILEARTEGEIDAAFTTLTQRHVDALVIGNDPFFDSRIGQLVALTGLHAVAAIQSGREFPDSGGLMSYGTSLTAVYRQQGISAGRILKSTKPTDLPVEQPTRFELVINLKTAKALGLTVPQALLARADEVIE